MITCIPRGRAEEAVFLGADDVDVGVLFRAEVNRRVVGAVTLDLDLRQIGERRADGVVFLVRDLELGREIVAPVAEQLADYGLVGLRQGVPRRTQRHPVVVDQREAQHALLELVVAQRSAVVLIDVPVDLDRLFLGLGLAGRGQRKGTGVEAVGTGGILDAGDIRIGHFTPAVGRVGQAGARGGALVLLVVGEEEQLVLDDRATKGAAVGLLVVEAVELDAFELLAHHVLVAIGVIDASVELVGARLGHRVDHGAGTTGDGGVVVGQVDVDRLDRVHRHRLALGRQVVGLQAERVAGADAVDADGVVAGVLAAGRDRTVSLADLRDARIEADVVLDVAVGRRQRFDGFAADVGAGAHLVGAEDFRTGDGNGFHRGERGDVVFQFGIDRVDLAQRQVDVFFGVGTRARLVDGDAVRATDAQAARGVTAAGIRGGAADRARFDVGDRDFRTRDRLAIRTGDDTGNAGGGALRESGGCGKCDDQPERQLGKSNAGMLHGQVSLGYRLTKMRGGAGRGRTNRWESPPRMDANTVTWG